MDTKEFRQSGMDMLDYIANYLESISHRSVSTTVHPGYLKTLLPKTAPDTGESIEKIMEDLEKCIMPGLNHWQHPRFHAFFPSNSSYPSILAELLYDTFGCTGYSWRMSPAACELETFLTNWFAKMLGLPECFQNHPERSGGGLMKGSTSESVFNCMVTARTQALEKLSQKKCSISKPVLIASLVAYCSEESSFNVHKAALLTLVTIKTLPTDNTLCLRGGTLADAIREDKEIGLIPFFVSITLGTASGSCDPVDEIGRICEEHDLWLHVDGSYAGNALICPEYRHLLNGIERATSFIVNPSKWLMVPIGFSVLFAKDLLSLSYCRLNTGMLGYDFDEENWFSKKTKAFDSFKLWFMLRSYGVEKLQQHIRNHVQLAEMFRQCVSEDERFEVLSCHFGIVCFRLTGDDKINKMLLQIINTSGKLLLNFCSLKGKFAIRIIFRSEHANEEDVISAWTAVKEYADKVFGIDKNNEDLSFSDRFIDTWDCKLF